MVAERRAWKGRGRPNWERRRHYFALMAQGWNNSAACREVGITRRSGTKWRYGYTQVNRAGQRYVVARLVPGRRRPPRPDGSISPRDRDKWVAGTYHPHRAEQRARVRRARPKLRKLALQPELHGWVQDRLGQRWSSEQISSSLPSLFPDRPEMRVATETLYQALYVQGRGELRRELTRALRTGRACRRPRRGQPSAATATSLRWS